MAAHDKQPGKVLNCVAEAARAMCERNNTTLSVPEEKADEAFAAGSVVEAVDGGASHIENTVLDSSHPVAQPGFPEVQKPEVLPHGDDARLNENKSWTTLSVVQKIEALPETCHVDLSSNDKTYCEPKQTQAEEVLSSADMEALRNDALEAATHERDAFMPDSSAPNSAPSSTQEPCHVSFATAGLPALHETQDEDDNNSDDLPGTPRRDKTQLSLDFDMPEEAEDVGIVSMHASMCSPTQHSQGNNRNMSGCNLLSSTKSDDRLFGSASAKKLSHVVQLSHGSVRPTTVGFNGKGPFWTCDREAVQSLREKRRGSLLATGDGASRPGEQACGSAMACVESTSEDCAQGSITSRATRLLGSCVDMLAGALSASADTSPPDGELTTVLLETKEQRLHWREFLCESVSKSSATNLYSAFDVEAEPPRYAKPPVSSAMPSQSAQEAPAAVHLVAPQGAGWSESAAPRSMIRPVTSSGIATEADLQSLPAMTSLPLGSPIACCVSEMQDLGHVASSAEAGKAEGHGRAGPPPAG